MIIAQAIERKFRLPTCHRSPRIPRWIGLKLLSIVVVLIFAKEIIAECENKNSISQVEVSSILRESNDNVDVVISVRLPREWFTYSVTQHSLIPSGGPMRTQITLDLSPGFQVQGEPTATPKPTIVRYEEIWPKLDIEIHKDKVSWSIPIKLSSDVNISCVEIKGNIAMQVEAPTSATIIKRSFHARRITK